jgi:hypothetical protein
MTTPKGAVGRRTRPPLDPLDDLLERAVLRAAGDPVVQAWLRRLASADDRSAAPPTPSSTTAADAGTPEG